MRAVLCAILLFTLTTGHSQRQFKYFYGQVLDQQTLSPLAGVNIAFEGLKQGSITDRKGEFSFFLDTIPVYMIITHVGYEKKKIWLDGTSPKLSVRLTPSATVLKEVEIVAKAGPEAFYRDESYSVLDYEVDSSRVYILIYRITHASAELLCRTVDGREVASTGLLPFRCDSLFRDCLGFVHLITRDSAYQVFTDSSSILLVYPSARDKFEEVMKNCVASTSSKLFFRKVTNDGFGVEFSRVDRLTRQKERMATVVDEENLERLRRNMDDYGRIRSSKIPDGRTEFEEWSFARKIMYRPSTASMFRVAGNICIFNTADLTIEFYTPEGDFTSKVKLDLSRADGRWTKEILVDEVRNEAYTTFTRNGTLTMYRVNLETGSVSRSTRLGFVYPGKVKVHDGRVFYLYDVPGEQDNKQLYRQVLVN